MQTRLIGAVLLAWAGTAWAQAAVLVTLTLNQGTFRPGVVILALAAQHLAVPCSRFPRGFSYLSTLLPWARLAEGSSQALASRVS